MRTLCKKNGLFRFFSEIAAVRMAITTPSNTHISDVYDGQIAGLAIGSTADFNQGDMLIWDTTLNSGNGGLRVPTTQADIDYYVGIAAQTNPVTSLNDIINNSNVWKSGKFYMKTTSGETYKAFQPVYFNENADAQTITNSTATGARTKPIGFICIPQDLVVAGVLTVLGAAGVSIPVLIVPQYPVNAGY
jgi:hypothetical protein